MHRICYDRPKNLKNRLMRMRLIQVQDEIDLLSKGFQRNRYDGTAPA
jgi:hypothetical protein